MAIVQFYGVVRAGQIELTRPIDVPDGTPVTITTAELAADPPAEDFPAIGMWADRAEMSDPVEYLSKRRAECRQRRLFPDSSTPTS